MTVVLPTSCDCDVLIGGGEHSVFYSAILTGSLQTTVLGFWQWYLLCGESLVGFLWRGTEVRNNLCHHLDGVTFCMCSLSAEPVLQNLHVGSRFSKTQNLDVVSSEKLLWGLSLPASFLPVFSLSTSYTDCESMSLTRFGGLIREQDCVFFMFESFSVPTLSSYTQL